MRIFLDDERNPPPDEADWIVMRDPIAALAAIRVNLTQITELSFDNDLGAEWEGASLVGRGNRRRFAPGTDLARFAPHYHSQRQRGGG